MHTWLYEDLFKDINVTGIHLLDLQILQDKNWMKNNQFTYRKKNRDIMRYKFRIAIRYKFFVYCNISY